MYRFFVNNKALKIFLTVFSVFLFTDFFRAFALESYLLKIVDADGSIKRITEQKTLKVGTDPNIGMPYVKRESKYDYRGFEVDISKYIATEFECEAKFIPTNWENLMKGLEEKKYDFAIGAIEKPEELSSKFQNIGFSKSYYSNSYHIVVRKDNSSIRSIHSMKNKKVGVIENSFGKILLNQINTQKKTNITLITYPNTTELFDALQKNLVTSIIIDTPIATWNCESENMPCKKVGLPIYSNDYVIAVRKEDRALLNGIDAILLESKRIKKLNEILTKWNLD